jgi:nitrate/nitrite transporter NarK
MPAINDNWSQEAAGIIYSLVLLAYAAVWWASARNAADHRAKTTNYGQVLRSGWTLWQLALFYFVAFGGFVAMSLYLPKLLTDWFDYSQTRGRPRRRLRRGRGPDRPAARRALGRSLRRPARAQHRVHRRRS